MSERNYPAGWTWANHHFQVRVVPGNRRPGDVLVQMRQRTENSELPWAMLSLPLALALLSPVLENENEAHPPPRLGGEAVLNLLRLSVLDGMELALENIASPRTVVSLLEERSVAA